MFTPPARLLPASLALLLVLAPSTGLPQIQLQPTPVPTTAEQPVSFADWVVQFRRDALASGIRADLYDSTFYQMEPDDSVLRADSSQPEFTRPVWEYLDSATAPSRVQQGREMLAILRGSLTTVEQAYGVDRNILIAIWGMESNFGSNIGNKDVVRSLATLAWHGRRAVFAREQLLAALQILQQGHYRGPGSLPGSWAGAMGQTQFMPTTFQQHAVDFDGDGRRDIWQTSIDALASTANYLRKSGWQSGQRWGMEVFLPAGFDYALADPGLRKPVSEWLALGVQPGVPLRTSEMGQSASLLLPAGYRGPALLVLDNFRALLTYNNSTSYALGVALLAGRFSGDGYLRAGWPLDEPQLSLSQRMELQQRLNALGYNTGNPDGIIGFNTRAAVRALQQHLGWPADGQPTVRLLDALRRMQ